MEGERRRGGRRRGVKEHDRHQRGKTADDEKEDQKRLRKMKMKSEEKDRHQTSLVSEDVLAFLRCRNIDIYGVHKNVKFLRHL